jgi:hypothetical protein
MSFEARTFFSAVCLFGSLGFVSLACGDGVDDREPAWDYISPAITQPACASSSCHSRAAAAAGLDFSDPERGYKSLTSLWVWIVDPSGTKEANCKEAHGTVVCQRAFRPLVVPFNPSQSRLVNMLRARGATRMPPDRPLPEADIRLIERWILRGAKPPEGYDPPPTPPDGGAPRDAGAADSAARRDTTPPPAPDAASPGAPDARGTLG